MYKAPLLPVDVPNLAAVVQELPKPDMTSVSQLFLDLSPVNLIRFSLNLFLPLVFPGSCSNLITHCVKKCFLLLDSNL